MLRCADADFGDVDHVLYYQVVAAAPDTGTGAAGEAPAGNRDPEEESLCVICLAAERTVGFMHGRSVHRCVCAECSELFKVGSPCPLCRQPVEVVVAVY